MTTTPTDGHHEHDDVGQELVEPQIAVGEDQRVGQGVDESGQGRVIRCHRAPSASCRW